MQELWEMMNDYKGSVCIFDANVSKEGNGQQ